MSPHLCVSLDGCGLMVYGAYMLKGKYTLASTQKATTDTVYVEQNWPPIYKQVAAMLPAPVFFKQLINQSCRLLRKELRREYTG